MKYVFLNAGHKQERPFLQNIVDEIVPTLHGQPYGVLTLDDLNNVTMVQSVMQATDVLVLVIPVGIFGIPSQLVGFMADLEMRHHSNKCEVYTVLLSDYPNHTQNKNVCDQIKQWCKTCYLTYKNTICFDCVGKNEVNSVLMTTLKQLFTNDSDQFVHYDNALLYSVNQKMKWRKLAKNYGLNGRDLKTKLNENIFKIK